MIELRHTDAQTLQLGFGGDTLNTAVYLARVGGKAGLGVDYITALGDDRYSADMLTAWRTEGVGTELVARLPGRLPGLYIIRTDERGERSFTYFRSAAAARDMLRDGRDRQAAERLKGHACVYLSGVTLSILDEDQRHVLVGLLERLRAGGTKIAFDSNYRPAGWRSADEARRWMVEILRRADIALPTLDDEQRLFGDPDAGACVARIRGLGVSDIALKLGADGAVIPGAGGPQTVPPAPVRQVVDTTAAGDSFNAGYLFARLLGRAPAAAAAAGNRLAAAVVQHPGAIIPRAATPGLNEQE
jgi:2-dehydro-3-deoxygluconokinase